MIDAQSPPAPDFQKIRFKAEPLALLFAKLKVELPSTLAQVCETTQSAEMRLPPVARIGRILTALQLRNIKTAQLMWDRLDRRCLPALVCVDSEWRVIEAAGDDVFNVYREDGQPELIPGNELAGMIVLWLQPVGQKAEETASFAALNSRAARLVLAEMFKHRRWLVDVLVATLAVNVLAVATSLFAMQVYDRVVPTFSYATLGTMVAGMGIVMVLDWVLKKIRSGILDGVAKGVDEVVSQKVFEHLLHLRLDTRPQSLGTLAAQVNGLEAARNFFSSAIVFALTDLPFAVVFVALIGLIGGMVGWVYAVTLPMVFAVGWFAQRRLRVLSKNEIQRGNERHGLLVDVIHGSETIQAGGAAWRFAEAWRSITASMAGYSFQSKQITSTTMATAGTLGTLSYVVAIVVGVNAIEAGTLTMGGLIACTILGGRVIGPVAQSVQTLVQWQHVREALQMVDSMLALDTDRRADQELLVPDALPEKLELEGLRFSYPQSPILRINIPSLSVHSGERIVILGPLGSGKSTLLKVLAGLYRPSEGRVKLGHADLWELEPQIVVQQVSYLPQDVHLFKGTLRSNLVLSGTAGDSRLLEVIHLLGIDQIAADNPRSMDLEISEGGHGLSGGQRQLVGLGRVFLAQPRVWLLDEPTAALDNESEQRVLHALQTQVRSEDILIVATHRPRLVSLANRVLIMRRGQIVADGKPEDVLSGPNRAMPRHA